MTAPRIELPQRALYDERSQIHFARSCFLEGLTSTAKNECQSQAMNSYAYANGNPIVKEIRAEGS